MSKRVLPSLDAMIDELDGGDPHGFWHTMARRIALMELGINPDWSEDQIAAAFTERFRIVDRLMSAKSWPVSGKTVIFPVRIK